MPDLILPPKPVNDAEEQPPISCPRCIFFKRETPLGATRISGQCRRMPPVPVFVGVGQQVGQLSPSPIVMPYYTGVGSQDWCGEFQPEIKRGAKSN